MLNFLIGQIRGILTFFLYLINTVFWATPLLFIAFLKLIVPIRSFRRTCEKILNRLAENWIFCNSLNQQLLHNIRWDVQGVDTLKRDQWYLVMANHQSWADILVLQKIFYRRIPFLKFFIKKEMIWMPILGLVWWALDFPFMKRYSQRRLQKKPHLKGQDLETTRKACRKFRTLPVSIMNFVEGTRFTPQKQDKQQSPYTHLLKPKAGGIALVLAVMGQQLDRILDVTIVYPRGVRTFWEFMCGKVPEIKVRVAPLPISEEILGDYDNDPEFRRQFQNWLNKLWSQKDEHIKALLYG